MVDVTHSPSLASLGPALVKAQAHIKGAVKDSTNPFFKSRYADLSSVWEACREALNSNGLSVTQFPGYQDGVATVTTILLHSSGEWIKGTAGAPLKSADAQGVGSAVTYLRRYALAAVAGVVQEDDDGQSASRKPERKAPERRESAPRASVPPLAVDTDPYTGQKVAPPDLSKKPEQLTKPEPPLPTAAETPVLKWKNRPLTEFPSDDLLRMKQWCVKTDPHKWATYIEAMDALLASRQGE